MSFEPARAASEKYISLATKRKNGKEVLTPVWLAELDGRAFVYTNGDSGKAKRIRNNGSVRIAPCTMRGDVTGEWTETHAELIDDAEHKDRVVKAFVKKYGWQMRLAQLLTWLGGTRNVAIIELKL